MADNILSVKIKQRYDTESNWSANNPVLLEGEIAISSDKKLFKTGDGTSTWSQLPYNNANAANSATTASKLATARTIALTGSVTGSGTFDGSGNLSIATSTNHTHSYAGSSSAGGSATSAVKLDSSAGSATQPVYFSSGKPVACTYTLSKSVPSDAKFTDTTYSNATTSAAGLMSKDDKAKLDSITASADAVSFSRSLTSGTKVGTITINGTGTDLYAPTNTDTHWTTGLKVGDSNTATANAAASNGSVYLNVLDNTTVRDSHKITGTGATTVTSDANGVITVNSTNTTYSAGTGLSLSGTTFNHKKSETADSAHGDASKTLTFGGTFTIPVIAYDAQGHITGKGTTTMTMPANPATTSANGLLSYSSNVATTTELKRYLGY